MSEGETPASHLGLQIAIAVSTGVLVIAATSVAAILLGSRREPATTAATPGGPSGSPAVTSASPDPTQTAPASPSPSPSASPSPKRSPAVKPSASTPPAVTLRSVQCDRTEISLLDQANCTVKLSAAAPGDVTVALEADTSDVSMPSAVIVPAGATMGEFVVRANGGGSGGPTTITARLGTAAVTTTIAVKVATAGKPSP